MTTLNMQIAVDNLPAAADRLEAADLVAQHEFDRLVDVGHLDAACSRMLTHLQRTEVTRRRLYGRADLDAAMADYLRCHADQFHQVSARIIKRLAGTVLSSAASTPPVHEAKGRDLNRAVISQPQAQPPTAEPCATDETPRQHLGLVPDPPPAEPEVLCGHPSPHLVGFSCANPPHADDHHWFLAQRRMQVTR